MKQTFTIIALLLSINIFANSKASFTILPKPQKMEIGKKDLLSLSELKYIHCNNSELPVLGSILNNLPQGKRAGKGIILSITTQNVPEQNEGYTLKISKSGISINSRSQAGLFYACATLEQMLQDCNDFALKLPETNIVDYPNVEYRAVYFDNKHHLSRAEYYYTMINKLASYKINGIIWEIEDKLRYERRPEIGAPNALSKQEFQAISRYAKERNIEISPLVQGLGHASFILKHHWELRESEKSDWEFCPSNPKTYELQFDLYRDAMEAFPYGKYLHVGGDEISAIGIDDRCKATGKSPFELQMQWLKKVTDFATAHGRTPIFWDDMPLKHGNIWGLLHRGLSDEKVAEYWNTEKLDNAISLFPKNCIYMRWHYEDPTILANKRVLEWYQNAGLKVMGATAAATGGSPFMPRNNSRAQYIKDFSHLVHKNNLAGILATSWDDGSPHWETVVRGFIAQAEYGWNTQARTVEEFKTAHAQREWGFINNEESFIDNLEKLAYFFDDALITKGRRNPSWQVKDFTLMHLPNKDSIGAWSNKYAEKLNKANEAVKMHAQISNGIQGAKQNARRNRYTINIYEQNLELFLVPAKIILALERYDKATNEEQISQAKENLQTVISEFNTMRTNLENEYSQTRFMQQPNGFISDMNHHKHLSSLSLNSDWLYLYELAMIKKIENSILK